MIYIVQYINSFEKLQRYQCRPSVCRTSCAGIPRIISSDGSQWINNAEQRPGMASNMGHDKWQGKAWKSLEAAETSQICPGEVAKCLDFPCDMEIVFLDSTNS